MALPPAGAAGSGSGLGLGLGAAAAGLAAIAPKEAYAAPLVAQGDWTKNLVHLAKTAELKKHALTLQLHTAHILSAHATLDSKNKALQDIKEQKNRLESERTRLLSCLREVNEDRDKADLLESSINKECTELEAKIASITEGEYAAAKREVDALRGELGQAPMPGLQATLDEKAAAYLNERRLNGDGGPGPAKRVGDELRTADGHAATGKRPRGRPKGSKNRNKANSGGAVAALGVPAAGAEQS